MVIVALPISWQDLEDIFYRLHNQ